jgi:O-antigen ligase
LGGFAQIPEHWQAERDRPRIWRDSLGAVEAFWLTGSGLSSYRYVTSSYRSFSGRTFYSWAHNDYLQLVIELGVPGLLLLFWTMAVAWQRARRAQEELSRHAEAFHLHAGYCAAAVAITLHTFTDFSLHLQANFAMLSAVLGLAIGSRPPLKPGPVAHNVSTGHSESRQIA